MTTRDALIDQGVVAPGCTLQGDLSFVLAFGGASPCRGCNMDRTSCGIRIGEGFTHQWRDEALQDFREFCMASTEDTASTREAWEKGWRTFRLRPAGTPLLRGEIECVERTRGVVCADCTLCRGTSIAAKHISIQVHGNATARAAGVSRYLELARAGVLSSR